MSLAKRDSPSGKSGPPTGRIFLASAAVNLVLGLTLQAAHMADLWMGLNPLAYTSDRVIAQVLLVGWLSQAVIGLLYGSVIASPRTGLAAWVCLNLGLIMTVVGQPMLALTGSGLAGGSAVGGGLLQLAGGIFFVADLTATWWNGTGTKDEHRQTPDA